MSWRARYRSGSGTAAALGWSHLAATLLPAALLLAGCNSPNPVAPTSPPQPGGSPGSGAYVISLQANPPQLPAGGTAGAAIAVSVRRIDNGQPPPGGTQCAISTNLGSFGNDASGKPITLVTLQLTNGNAQTQLFPAAATGTANLLAQVQTSVGQLAVPIVPFVKPPFYLTAVQPGTGSASGGDKVKILGAGFQAPVRVTFGSVVALVIAVASPNEIDVWTPRPATPVDAGTTQLVSVAVTNAIDQPMPASDTLPSAFTYTNGGSVDQPVIFSVTPPSGSNNGGDRVTILGAGFVPPVQVFFGLRTPAGGFDGVAATVQQTTSTQIVALTPAAIGTAVSLLNQQVDVMVRNETSGFSTTAASAFRYLGQDLFVRSMTPSQGSYTGGTTVVISGQGFDSGGAGSNPPVQVRFGGAVQQVTAVQPTQITVTTVAVPVSGCQPPSGPLTVINLRQPQTAASSIVFTYTANPPVLSSVNPASGNQAGGYNVTINGASLPQNSRVEFGGVPSQSAGPNPATPAAQLGALVPAFSGQLDSDPCSQDGVMGSRFRPKAVDVKVTDLATGCSDTLPLAFTYTPADTSCRVTVARPVADFTFQLASKSLTVLFTDASRNNPTSWFWTFGDPSSTSNNSLEQNPAHAFSAAGTYTVSLTATNQAGSSTVSKFVTVSLGKSR
ncbi:MAG: IPT/TIG domain-containing protein [Acidobacteriota bacterium]|nr:IPT/TIG domain-containing protein [Acidobacteriota bacterium]